MEIIEVVNSNGTEVTEPTFTISSQGGGGTSDQPSFYIELTKKLVYHASSDTENDYTLKLRVTSNNNANELIVPNISIKLSNVRPIISKMSRFAGLSLSNPLFNFNDAPFNGDFKDRNTGVDSSEDFNVNEYTCRIWSQDAWNYYVKNGGKVGIASFAVTSNGSDPNLSNASHDATLRQSNFNLIDPINSRLRDLQYKMQWTGLETRTCQYEKDTGKVLNIGWQDSSGNFPDKWGGNPFEISEVTGDAPKVVVNYVTNTIEDNEIPTTITSPYGNGGDNRAALLVTSTFFLEDANGATGTKTSEKYITRTIIYKGVT